MSFDINSIINDLEAGAIEAAKTAASQYVATAAGDALEFVHKVLPSIERYAALYLDRKITLEELQSLLMGLINLAEMAGLTQAGIASIQIDNTKNILLKTITSIVTGTLTKLI